MYDGDQLADIKKAIRRNLLCTDVSDECGVRLLGEVPEATAECKEESSPLEEQGRSCVRPRPPLTA